MINQNKINVTFPEYQIRAERGTFGNVSRPSPGPQWIIL